MRRLTLILACLVLVGCEQWRNFSMGTGTGGMPLTKRFILIGQSNMAGVGMLDDRFDPDGRVTMHVTMPFDERFTEASEALKGPGFIFGREVASHGHNVELYQCAQPGQITYWDPFNTNFHRFDDCMNGLPKGDHFDGVLYWNGESDAMLSIPGWAQNFTILINTIRKRLNDPNLPVVYAQLGTPSTVPPAGWAMIQQEQASVALSRSRMVSMDGIWINEGYHPKKDGYVEAGERFYRGWIGIE